MVIINAKVMALEPISGKSEIANPYMSQRIRPKAHSDMPEKEIAFVSLSRMTLSVCGTQHNVVNMAAPVPIVLTSSDVI